MLTIFTFPRPFKGPFDIIQRNAIQSWKSVCPDCEIILANDEENTAKKVSKDLNLKCLDNIVSNEFGTLLFDNAFKRLKKVASFDALALISTDIILISDLTEKVTDIKSNMKKGQFFVTGQRWDLDLDERIVFENPDWKKNLLAKVHEKGKLHPPSAMDYWIFPHHLSIDFPPFTIGRPGMDSWIIYKLRSLRIPVIDATRAITVIHQNHNYPRRKDYFFEIEKERNIKLAGGLSCMSTLRDADWLLTKSGELQKPKFPRRIFSLLTLFYPWRMILFLKRKLQRIL